MKAVQQLIDRLVDQFSDPYAFLRELVQNSMDAGSHRIEFDFHYSAVSGLSVLQCVDTGEGMDEQAIDSKLTRLFASSKDNDLTKIGKYGIGFLSVFALKPREVVVDTGRNGQFWRIHFKADRTFTKSLLDEPVEGTRIRWIKAAGPRWHEKFRANCKSALQHWCKHAKASVWVEGVVINKPFEWDHPAAVYDRQVFAEVALMPSHPAPAWAGFYNQGLTLVESSEAPLEGVLCKISSPYLEHTLTRDSLQRDKNFAKALRIVHQVFRQKLLPRLLELAQQGGELAWLAPHWQHLSAAQKQIPLLSGIARLRYSLQDVIDEIDSHHSLLYCVEDTPLARLLLERGRRLLLWPGLSLEPGWQLLLRGAGPQVGPQNINELYALPVAVQPSARQRVWLDRLHWLLQPLEPLCQSLELADFDYPGSSVTDRPHLPSGAAGEPSPLALAEPKGRPYRLWINVAHPLWQPLWELEEDWGVAAACQSLWEAFPQHSLTDLLERAAQTL